MVVTGTFSHLPAYPTGVPGDLPDPQPLCQPGEPPALLGREGPPRPSAISKMGASAVAVLPEYLSRYPVNEIPVDQLGLFGLESGHPRRLLRFLWFLTACATTNIALRRMNGHCRIWLQKQCEQRGNVSRLCKY